MSKYIRLDLSDMSDAELKSCEKALETLKWKCDKDMQSDGEVVNLSAYRDVWDVLSVLSTHIRGELTDRNHAEYTKEHEKRKKGTVVAHSHKKAVKLVHVSKSS